MSMIISKKKQRKVSLLLVFLMFLSIVVPGFTYPQAVNAQAVNLARNPSFETGTATPQYWTPAAGFENLMVWDTEKKYEGQKSLKLSTSDSTKRSIYDQADIPVAPGNKYLLSAYCLTENLVGNAKIELYFYDSKKVYISTGGYKTLTIPKQLNEWTLESLGEMQSPANAAYAKIRLMVMSGTGNVWFDNVSLTKIIQPDDLAYVTATADKTTLSVGESVYLKVEGTLGNESPADLSTATVTCTSDDTDIATVDGRTVTAVRGGTANINVAVTFNSKTEYTSIPILVSGIEEYCTYDFKLPVNSTLDTAGWQVAGNNLTGTVSAESNAPYRHQSYGIQVDSRNVGEYISFDVKVPKEGYYDITFKGANYPAGALAAISLDGHSIGDYNFYATANMPDGRKTAYDPMLLSEGVHSFVVSVKQKGVTYWTMYPSELKLARRSDMPGVSSLKATANYTKIEAGATSQMTVTGVTYAGQDIGVDGIFKIYASDNEAIATVNQQGLITGVTEGTANIKAGIIIGNTVLEAIQPITVTGILSSVKYNFKDGILATIDNNGWKVEASNTTYRNQPYGIQVQSDAVDKYITMSINVPVKGYFTPEFIGAGAGGGAIADLLIDNIFVGQVDFYSAAYIPAQPQIMLKTLMLDRGIHEFTLKVVGKSQSWGYNMYPGELELVRQDSLPVLTSVEASSSMQDLAVGQTAKISAVGVMSNGYRDILKGIDVSKSYTSQDSTIATVDGNGTVKAVKSGLTKINIIVTINGVAKETTVPITVNEKVLKTVEATLGKNEIPVGITTTASVIAKLDDGSIVNLIDTTINYTSDNEQVATINSAGIVTPVAEGTANIKAEVTLGNTNVSGEIQINVVPVKLETIAVTSDKSKLFIGRQALLTVSGTLNNTQNADMSVAAITYKSSDPVIVEVDAKGIVTAKASGIAQISVTVTINGVTKTDNSITITVESTEGITSSKTKATYYTPEKIAAARENIEKYDWAKATRDGAVEEANKYVDQAELLWNIVTQQSIPRGILVNSEYKCPNCGTDLRAKFGNYPWIMDPVNDPWKVKCPQCGIRFPSNDFGAYYKSGLDEHGTFVSAKADKSLLVNTLYPEKGEKWGVDDGFGFIDVNSKVNSFIAYYTHWGVWYSSGIIQKALNALRDAYLYTGDIKYARTGTALLDRIADVYPSMTLDPYSSFLNSDGGTHKGKVIGSIWETELVQAFIKAYDAFFPAMDDEELVSFLMEKSAKYDLDNPKNRGALIRKNIEDGIIRQVYPAVKNAQIRGNFGMHQAALALAAVVLDSNPDTKEWLDFNFQAGEFLSGPYRVTGGDIMATLVNKVDRDGNGNEAAPGYNTLWLGQLKEAADALDGYEGYPGADLYKNPKFMKMFSAMYPLMLCERYTAQIGDSGGTGNPGLFLSITDSVSGFIKFGDPVLAQLAYFLNNNSAKGLHATIFTRDPEKVSADIQQVINEKGKLNLESDNLAGYGFSVLRDGKNNKQYFGLQLAFQNLSAFDSTAGFKLFASSGTIQFEADATGHHISFKFNVPKTDVYELDLNPFKAGSYGIYDVYIDGVKSTTIDFYGGSGANSKLEVLKKMELTEGEHTITFEGIGKNEASTGYKLGLIHLVLFDEEALLVKNDDNKLDTQRDFWMYYGRANTSHAHRDQLNLGVHAYGLDLAPELGYPEETGAQPNRIEWVSNTISHNTVVVDASRQNDTYDGTPLHYDAGDMVKLIDVDSKKAYSQTDMYRRTIAMIKVSDEISYGVDFFRVKGGNDHYYSFHGAEGTVTTDGLNLVAQASGTYAGTDVAFGQRADGAEGWSYTGSGFHWLTNVQKDENPGSSFSVDWDIVDGRGVLIDPLDLHLRLTMLGDVDDVAIMDGQPPKKPGNPQWLKYMIAHRKGQDLNSLFTSVIEPYKDTRYIESISEVSVTANGQEVKEDIKAVKIVLKDGRIDYVINALDNSIVYTVDGKFKFKGFLGVYSEKDGKQVYGYVNDGNIIGNINAPANIAGTVKSFTKDLSTSNELTVELADSNINLSSFVGKFIYIDNDGTQNAAYKILGVKAQNGKEVILDLGASTFIRSFVDSKDLSKGYIFNIAEGNTLRIPLGYQYIMNPDNSTDEGNTGVGGTVTPPVDSVKEDGSIVINNSNVTVKDGEAAIEVKQDSFSKAIANAVKLGKDIITVQIPDINNAVRIAAVIPAIALNDAMEKGIESISIISSIAQISISPDALKNSVTKDAKKVEVVIAAVDKKELEPEVVQIVGNNAVYDFNIYADGEKVTNFTGKKAIEITLPYDLAQGEDASKIVAYYINDKGKLEVVKHCTYDAAAKTITFNTNHLSRYVAKEAAVSFKDVKENNWSAPYINALAAREIIKGRNVGEFAPEENITRAEFLKLIMEAFSLIDDKAQSDFSDVEQGEWYYKSIASAEKLGIVSGIGDNKFGTEDLITRQDMAVMAYKAAKAAQAELLKVNNTVQFNDKVSISGYALDSISAMQEAGILSGMENNRFMPQGMATREQAAKIVLLLFKLK